MSKCYAYVLLCADNTLYTGWTTDLEKRLKAHNEGRGGKYTRARTPCKIFYYEEFDDKISAMRREYAIKQLTREQKLALVDKKTD